MRFSGPSTAPPCAVTRSIDAVGLFLEGLPIAEIFDVVWIETSAELKAIHVVDGVLHASEILECRLAANMNAVAPCGISADIRHLPVRSLPHELIWGQACEQCPLVRRRSALGHEACIRKRAVQRRWHLLGGRLASRHANCEKHDGKGRFHAHGSSPLLIRPRSVLSGLALLLKSRTIHGQSAIGVCPQSGGGRP